MEYVLNSTAKIKNLGKEKKYKLYLIPNNKKALFSLKRASEYLK